jgi:glutathione S-transferase
MIPALYHNDMSTCAQKVRLTLAEKGVQWEGKHLNLRARDQQQPDYLKLNPNAVVPTLVHDGVVVIESTVINEYVDDAFDGPALKPADAAGRARMRFWTKQLDEGLHADTGVISGCIAFRYQKLERGTAEVEALLANTPNPAKRERNRDILLKGTDSYLFRDSILRFDALLARMEETLSESPWLAGDTLSIADCAYAPYLTRLDHLQMQPMWAHRPHLADWYARVRARPGYQEALARWFNPKYLTLMEEKGKQEWPKIAAILEGPKVEEAA